MHKEVSGPVIECNFNIFSFTFLTLNIFYVVYTKDVKKAPHKDSNLRPSDYEADALPLSYVGKLC